MELLSFRYRDGSGQERDWTLKRWKESGKYLTGFSTHDDKYRTFRKDRVLEFLDGSDSVLLQPFIDPPPPISAKPDVLFTGFLKARRAELEAIAADAGMRVRKTVTRDLVFLCCGPNAGPTKVEGAREKGAFIMFEESFLEMLETGELADTELFIDYKLT